MSTVAVDGKLTLAETCYLSLPEDWTGACVYADAAACVSLALTSAYFVLQLCATMRASSSTSGSASKRVPRRLQAAQVLALLLGVVWWLAAACTLQYFTTRADAAGLAHAPQRAAVLACCWGSLGLFALLLAGELLPAALARISMSGGSRLQQQQQQQQQQQHRLHAQELQLSQPTHQASLSAAGYTSAPASLLHPTGPPLHNTHQHQQQQQQQPHGVVMGIPCVPAAPVGRAYSMPQLLSPGNGPGAFQMALLMRGSGCPLAASQAVRLPSLQPPPPAVWGPAAGRRASSDSQGVAGRVVVVNRNI
ncbi:hypothetical protein COO60DRAFT_676213 [Scenedesmus sp. NREL 46B-D3]|nr:hypothetical protein COO60DRAFT_676213 [Scenedesmus sp. NREL 46B-D3]